MFLPNISDEEIAEACRLLMAYEVATIPQESAYDDIRSETYIAYMERLLAQAKAGTLIAPNVPMGWQYYTRKGLAAILIAALLAGIAMPERVMAGYRWLVEVIEQFFENRKTEYIYTSNADEDIEFVPMQFGYMPEGMDCEVKENNETEKILKLLYSRNIDGKFEYFEITQALLNDKRVHGSNTEIYYTEIVVVNNELIKVYVRQDIIHFSWVNDQYHMRGQTNLPREKLINILKNVELY
jgi:hypothetical protein